MIANDTQLLESEQLYLTVSSVEIRPNCDYALVELWHSIYRGILVTAIVIFEETRIKPSVTLNPAYPYEISPRLRIALEREVVKTLRGSWRWGRRVKTANG